jgi:hypothetical protein
LLRLNILSLAYFLPGGGRALSIFGSISTFLAICRVEGTSGGANARHKQLKSSRKKNV